MKTLIIGTFILICLAHGLFPPAVAYLIGAVLTLGVTVIALVLAAAEGDPLLDWETVDE